MKNFIFKHWQLLAAIMLSLFITWPVFMSGYFTHHDDLQVMRIFEMRKCFEDIQIPCRWVPDMGWGNGYPLFNFYGPLPFYIGAILSYLMGYIGAAKALFFIPLVLASISMYLFASKLFNKNVGLLSSVLYTYAPYRALDSYTRGAINESFAIAIIPLFFYFSLKSSEDKRVRFILLSALSLAGFLLSHNIMTILFAPVIILWEGYLVLRFRFKNLINQIVALGLSFGLSAFFTLPGFFEKGLVQSESLLRFELDFRANYVAVRQLFLDREWGYGASVLGRNDGISFQIGWPLWWLVGLTTILILLSLTPLRNLIKHFSSSINIKNLQTGNFYPLIIFIVVFLGATFMTHNKSAFIWEQISILRFTQFPWRFLSLVIFAGSLVGAYFLNVFSKRLQLTVLTVLIILTITLNLNFFRPKYFYPDLTDNQKLSGELWEEQSRASIKDYLPKTAVEPRERASDSPMLIEGDALIQNFVNRSNKWKFDANVVTPAVIELPIFDFPQWEVMVNGEDYPHQSDNYVGRIRVSLEPGEYQVSGYFANSPVRTYANLLSFLSLIILLSLIVYGKNRKNL